MQQVAMNADQAASSLGVSPRKVWSLVKEGDLDSRRIGRRVVITTDALRDYLAKLPSAATNNDRSR
jgi:excisionase family DNA binding protein